MSAHAQHGPTLKTFFGVFAGLMILTAITVFISYVELGPLNPIVALVIATCKALLVVLFFMELRWSPHITMIVVFSAICFLLILLGLTMSDYLTRIWGTYGIK